MATQDKLLLRPTNHQGSTVQVNTGLQAHNPGILSTKHTMRVNLEFRVDNTGVRHSNSSKVQAPTPLKVLVVGLRSMGRLQALQEHHHTVRVLR